MSAALDRLANRVATDRTFFASLLSAYATAHDLDDEGLCLALGVTPEALTRLRLCGVPRTWPASRFAEDCHAIANRFGMKEETVERVAWPW